MSTEEEIINTLGDLGVCDHTMLHSLLCIDLGVCSEEELNAALKRLTEAGEIEEEKQWRLP